VCAEGIDEEEVDGPRVYRVRDAAGRELLIVWLASSATPHAASPSTAGTSVARSGEGQYVEQTNQHPPP
jgi:hypothetical protein